MARVKAFWEDEVEQVLADYRDGNASPERTVERLSGLGFAPSEIEDAMFYATADKGGE